MAIGCLVPLSPLVVIGDLVPLSPLWCGGVAGHRGLGAPLPPCVVDVLVVTGGLVPLSPQVLWKGCWSLGAWSSAPFSPTGVEGLVVIGGLVPLSPLWCGGVC